jgi:hypothetical protein
VTVNVIVVPSTVAGAQAGQIVRRRHNCACRHVVCQPDRLASVGTCSTLKMETQTGQRKHAARHRDDPHRQLPGWWLLNRHTEA